MKEEKVAALFDLMTREVNDDFKQQLTVLIGDISGAEVIESLIISMPDKTNLWLPKLTKFFPVDQSGLQDIIKKVLDNFLKRPSEDFTSRLDILLLQLEIISILFEKLGTRPVESCKALRLKIENYFFSSRKKASEIDIYLRYLNIIARLFPQSIYPRGVLFHAANIARLAKNTDIQPSELLQYFDWLKIFEGDLETNYWAVFFYHALNYDLEKMPIPPIPIHSAICLDEEGMMELKIENYKAPDIYQLPPVSVQLLMQGCIAGMDLYKQNKVKQLLNPFLLPVVLTDEYLFENAGRMCLWPRKESRSSSVGFDLSAFGFFGNETSEGFNLSGFENEREEERYFVLGDWLIDLWHDILGIAWWQAGLCGYIPPEVSPLFMKDQKLSAPCLHRITETEGNQFALFSNQKGLLTVNLGIFRIILEYLYEFVPAWININPSLWKQLIDHLSDQLWSIYRINLQAYLVENISHRRVSESNVEVNKEFIDQQISKLFTRYLPAAKMHFGEVDSLIKEISENTRKGSVSGVADKAIAVLLKRCKEVNSTLTLEPEDQKTLLCYQSPALESKSLIIQTDRTQQMQNLEKQWEDFLKAGLSSGDGLQFIHYAQGILVKMQSMLASQMQSSLAPRPSSLAEPLLAFSTFSPPTFLGSSSSSSSSVSFSASS